LRPRLIMRASLTRRVSPIEALGSASSVTSAASSRLHLHQQASCLPVRLLATRSGAPATSNPLVTASVNQRGRLGATGLPGGGCSGTVASPSHQAVRRAEQLLLLVAVVARTAPAASAGSDRASGQLLVVVATARVR